MTSEIPVAALSVVIMAHPARAAMVEELIESLTSHGEEAPGVVWDEGWNDRHRTGLEAMLAYDPEKTHHLILQDDIVPSGDLVATVSGLVRHSGDHPVGLYVGRVRPRHRAIEWLSQEATARRVPFFSWEGPWWGPGIVLPTKHIPELAEAYAAMVNVDGYDRRIYRWYREQGIECWYTSPSLVEHRDDTPSLVYGVHTTTGRTSRNFLGQDRTGLSIDWSVGPLTIHPDENCQHGKAPYQRCVYCERW